MICWEWKGVARDEGAEAGAWFSEYLGKPSQLVRFLGAAPVSSCLIKQVCNAVREAFVLVITWNLAQANGFAWRR